MRTFALALAGICLGSTLTASRAPAQDFSQLLKYVPGQANAIVLIDVKAMLDAPLAQKEGWSEKLTAAYADRPIYLPPEANKLVLAASLKVNDGMDQRWELAIAEMDEPLPMRFIARSEGGYVDMIGEEAAAWSPSGAYFVGLDESHMGVVFPADRQFTARWLQHSRDRNLGRLSPYLQTVTKRINERIQYVMALDAEHAVKPHLLDDALETAEFLGKNVDREAMKKVVQSMRGVMMRLSVGDTAQGQIRVDFGEPTSPLKAHAKDLMLLAMRNQGAEISELEDWKLQVKDNWIALRGNLSEDGLRRLFSIVEIPTTKFSSLKDEDTSNKEPTESEVIASSQAYFTAVASLIEDLRRDFRGPETRNVSEWFERYARKIDRLPVLNVDDELLNYGSTVANTFRDMGLSRRQAGIRAGANIAGSFNNNYSNNYSNYGFGNGYGRGWRDTGKTLNRARIKQQEMAQAHQVRVSGWSEIDQLTGDVRQAMTKKYRVEFDVRPRRAAAAAAASRSFR